MIGHSVELAAPAGSRRAVFGKLVRSGRGSVVHDAITTLAKMRQWTDTHILEEDNRAMKSGASVVVVSCTTSWALQRFEEVAKELKLEPPHGVVRRVQSLLRPGPCVDATPTWEQAPEDAARNRRDNQPPPEPPGMLPQGTMKAKFAAHDTRYERKGGVYVREGSEKARWRIACASPGCVLQKQSGGDLCQHHDVEQRNDTMLLADDDEPETTDEDDVPYSARLRAIADLDNRIRDGSATSGDNALLTLVNRKASALYPVGSYQKQKTIVGAMKQLLRAASMTIVLKTHAHRIEPLPTTGRKTISYIDSIRIVELCVGDGWYDRSLADDVLLWCGAGEQHDQNDQNQYNDQNDQYGDDMSQRVQVRAGAWSRQLNLKMRQTDLSTLLNACTPRRADPNRRIELYESGMLYGVLVALRRSETRRIKATTDALGLVEDERKRDGSTDEIQTAIKTIRRANDMHATAEALRRLPIATAETLRAANMDPIRGVHRPPVRYQLVSNSKLTMFGSRVTNSSIGHTHFRTLDRALCDTIIPRTAVRFQFNTPCVTVLLRGTRNTGNYNTDGTDTMKLLPLLTAVETDGKFVYKHPKAT
jgi:hypothetical protein